MDEVIQMNSRRFTAKGLAVAAGLILAVAGGAVVSADHAWGTYHWARTTASFNLTIVNSTTPDWDPYVTAAVADWSQSSVFNMVEDAGGSTSTKNRRQCRAPSREVRICDLAYGSTGWLGVAGISIDSSGHITKGYTKLNDTYFSLSHYNTPNWKQMVTCQELGHNVGLDHEDEVFDNESLLSCMDYQDPPYAWANAHDFEQLALIYAHTDSYDSYAGGGSSGGAGVCNAPPGKGCNKAGAGQSANNDNNDNWGVSLSRRGAKEKFIRFDPDGTRHLTFVTWVEGH